MFIMATQIYFCALESQTNVLNYLTGATLQGDVIGNFQFLRLVSYLQRLSQSLQISKNRLCRITSHQNQKDKVQRNIFENIFEAADH